jgi:hypothetical protein
MPKTYHRPVAKYIVCSVRCTSFLGGTISASVYVILLQLRLRFPYNHIRIPGYRIAPPTAFILVASVFPPPRARHTPCKASCSCRIYSAWVALSRSRTGLTASAPLTVSFDAGFLAVCFFCPYRTLFRSFKKQKPHNQYPYTWIPYRPPYAFILTACVSRRLAPRHTPCKASCSCRFYSAWVALSRSGRADGIRPSAGLFDAGFFAVCFFCPYRTHFRSFKKLKPQACTGTPQTVQRSLGSHILYAAVNSRGYLLRLASSRLRSVP